MPTFQIGLDDGRKLRIEAESQEAALAGVAHFTSNEAAPAEAPITAGGLVKSAGTGLVRGAEYLAGLPGDLGKGVDWLFDKVGGPATPEQQAQLNALRPPSSSDVINAETKLTGGLHTAGNRAERATENIASFIPASLGGPEAIAANVLKRGVLPGAVSEAAGQATEGTPLELPARMIGALVQKGAARPNIASSEDIIKAGADGFDAFRQTPFAVKPGAMNDYANSTLQDFGTNRGFTPRTARDTTGLLNEYANRSASAVTSNDIDQLRQELRNVQVTGGGGMRDKEAAGAAISALHDRMNSFHPSDVVAGNLNDAASTWNAAHGNYAAGMSAKTFEDIATKATDKASAQNSGLNSGNKVRDAFATAVNDARKTRGLSDAEVAQLQKTVDGTYVGNTKRYIANTLGGGGGIGGLVAGRIIGGLAGAGAGAAVDGGRGSIEGGTLGAMLLANLLRRSYNRSVTNQANTLSESIRSRSPLAMSQATPVGPHVTPGVQRILNMSRAIGIAHGNGS